MEMMIAILIASFVLGAATTLLTGVASLNGTTSRQVQAQDDARRTVDQIATQLRNATGPPGAAPIYSPASGSATGTTDLVFYVPAANANTTNNPRGLQWVRYCLDYSDTTNEKLWMQTSSYDSTQSGPPSTASCPSSAWATQQLVVSSIVSMEATSSTTGCSALSTPAYYRCPFLPGVVANGTHDMRTKLIIKGDSARSNTTVTSSVDFRNVKSPPSTTMTCRTQNKHIICDASASADPDGQAITFQWKRTGDSTWEAGQSGYIWDSGLLTSGTYTVTCRVTDSDGLYTDATQTVTV